MPEKIVWPSEIQQKFDLMIDKVPVFLRGMARQKVLEKAESLARQSNRTQLTLKDLIDAFFEATPFGFHGPMKSDMQELGIDYEQFGYSK